MLNALRKQGGGLPTSLKAAIHLAGQGATVGLNGLTPGVGNLIAGAVTSGATKSAERAVNGVNARRLAAALMEMTDPNAARSAMAERITEAQRKQQVAQISRILAARTAPAAAGNRDRAN